MQLLRSAVFNAVMWLSVLIYAPLSLFTYPLSRGTRYRFIVQWARFHVWLAKVLCRIDYVVEGREHIPRGPAIILAKHQSTWETLALTVIFPPQTWVLKRELMWVPLFGWALALLKPIAIDRGAGRRAVEQVITQGRERLAEGVWITVFPEGTRVPPRTHARWGVAGAVLAAASGYPVVPVAHNAGSFWRRRGFIKRSGTIRVVVGPPIDARGRSADAINSAAREWIRAQMERLESDAAGCKLGV